MKPTIKLTKALVSVWKKELINKADCTAKTGVTYKTIVRAMKTRKCTRKVMDRINVYIIRERELRKTTNKAILSK